MSQISDFVVIAAMCGFILFIMFFRNKLEAVVHLLLRGALGIVAILGVNQVLLFCGVETLVGMNPVTVLTSMILGIPGVCALYFIVLI